MLKPKDLKNHSFTPQGRNAYKASEVDEYMDEVFRSYERMYHENSEMLNRMKLLTDRLTHYRDEEDNIRNALMDAQRMKAKIISEAEEEAKKELAETRAQIENARQNIDEKTGDILSRAQEEADRIVAEARQQAAAIEDEAQKKAEKKFSGAQKISSDIIKAAQEEYDKHVGNVSEQAEKERAYLEKIQTEAAELRRQLLRTYSMQIELLQAGPDFDTRSDVLSKFSKEDILQRPETDEAYSDPDLASRVDYEAYAAEDALEEDTVEEEAETADEAADAAISEKAAEAESQVEEELDRFSDDFAGIMTEDEAARVATSEEDESDVDDLSDLGNIADYLNDYDSDEDTLSDENMEEDPAEGLDVSEDTLGADAEEPISEDGEEEEE